MDQKREPRPHCAPRNVRRCPTQGTTPLTTTAQPHLCTRGEWTKTRRPGWRAARGASLAFLATPERPAHCPQASGLPLSSGGVPTGLTPSEGLEALQDLARPSLSHLTISPFFPLPHNHTHPCFSHRELLTILHPLEISSGSWLKTQRENSCSLSSHNSTWL